MVVIMTTRKKFLQEINLVENVYLKIKELKEYLYIYILYTWDLNENRGSKIYHVDVNELLLWTITNYLFIK